MDDVPMPRAFKHRDAFRITANEPCKAGKKEASQCTLGPSVVLTVASDGHLSCLFQPTDNHIVHAISTLKQSQEAGKMLSER